MKKEIQVSTGQQVELKDITSEVQDLARESGVAEGICVVYCPHTTAALAINENADPDVARDLEKAFWETVPPVDFRHAEGNSPAHYLSCMVGPSQQILISNGRLQLGRWQGIYFCEFDGPRRRTVWVKFIEG